MSVGMYHIILQICPRMQFSKHIISRAATGQSYTERSISIQVVTTDWTCELRSGIGFIVPVLLVQVAKKYHLRDQKLYNDVFFRNTV